PCPPARPALGDGGRVRRCPVGLPRPAPARQGPHRPDEKGDQAMSQKLSYRKAVERAGESRAKFLSSLDDAKVRIAPARLMADAKARALASILDIPASAVAKGRQRPFAVGAAIAAFLLYLFR